MNEFQQIQLNILKKVIEKLDENNYKWWAAGGTMLGAVRHNGFIPWDTDIDIYIEPSAHQFIESNPDIFEPYKTCRHWHFWKVYDEDTTGFAGGWKKGISIDLFPLERLTPKSLGDRNQQFREEVFDGYELYPFEDIQIRLPLHSEDCLTTQYGDWKTPKYEGGYHSNAECYFSLEKEWNDMVVVGIPVYHSRETLPRALDSLVLQTKKMFMVCIVNDADGEDYSDIIDEYRRRGLKITYLVQEENKGPGAARQRVIDTCAMCDFIMFLDSDDMYTPIAIDVMTRAIQQEGLDVVMANSTQLFNNKPAQRGELGNTSITWVWNKIYRRSYLVENDIRFPDNIYVSEDIAFSLPAWNSTKKHARLDQDIYYWCDNKNSLTRKEPKSTFDIKYISDFVRAQCCGIKKIAEITEVSPQLMSATLIIIYRQIQLANQYGQSEEDYIDELKSLRELEAMKNWEDNFDNWAYVVAKCPSSTIVEYNHDVVFFKERFPDWFKRVFTE